MKLACVSARDDLRQRGLARRPAAPRRSSTSASSRSICNAQRLARRPADAAARQTHPASAAACARPAARLRGVAACQHSRSGIEEAHARLPCALRLLCAGSAASLHTSARSPRPPRSAIPSRRESRIARPPAPELPPKDPRPRCRSSAHRVQARIGVRHRRGHAALPRNRGKACSRRSSAANAPIRWKRAAQRRACETPSPRRRARTFGFQRFTVSGLSQTAASRRMLPPSAAACPDCRGPAARHYQHETRPGSMHACDA